MTARVNLLPAAFVRRRRERRRRRLWVGVCLSLAAVQAGAFMVVSGRAAEVARQRAQAVKLNASLKQEKADRDTLRAKAAALAQDAFVAERLREKHCWSRWLGGLSLLLPPRVILTTVATEPPQWADAQGTALKPDEAATGTAVPKGVVRTLRLRGAAAQDDDVIALLKVMNGMKWFRSVQLEEARREKLGDRETIGFSVACDW